MAVHAVNGEVAVHGGMAVDHGDRDLEDLLGIRVPHAHLGGRLDGFHHALVDSERRYACGDVAAQARILDERTVDDHLAERVRDIGVVAVALPHDGQLAGEDVRTAQTVDLTRIGAAEDAQDQLVALFARRRQVGFVQVNALGCARAHDDGRHAQLLA